MLSPPPIRAMSTPALLALLLGEEAATRLAGRSLIEIFALHAGRTLLNEVHAGYGPERTLEACKELMARALAETMRLGDCLSDPATVRDYLTVAKQIFLAAYQKKMWGLDGVDLSQRKLAEWLTSQGYKTSVSAVKNGTREQPAEHLVPATDEVVAFLDKMKERFPGLETDKFLIR
jgi:hypothetical protein